MKAGGKGNNDLLENDGEEEVDDDSGINMEDFLKEGGLELGANLDSDKLGKVQEEKKEEVDTTPDENMKGVLLKSAVKMKGDGNDEDILGSMINGIGGGLKLGFKIFTETLHVKSTKYFFAIKNGVLYWYAHERSREASNSIPIKDTKAIELD